MRLLCNGCYQTFLPSAFNSHVAQSTSLLCRKGEYSLTFESGYSVADHNPTHVNSEEPEVLTIPTEPTGDFFGNYRETIEVEMLDSTGEPNLAVASDHERGADEGRRGKDDDTWVSTSMDGGVLSDGEDSDDEESELYNDGPGLEPPREPLPNTLDSRTRLDGPQDPSAVNLPPLRLRGGAEESLKNEPFVVKFPNPRAGEVVGNRDRASNEEYQHEVDEHGEGVYWPFSSKTEWEIAQWAKMRGPSSTAFTELLDIEGFREKLGLTFRTAKQLNDLIDNTLPGRPRFQRHEVMVGGEVCEVFYRDVMACIRALLGDPDLASKLVYLPERHYTDDSQQTRMYHDMHTGNWWWSTQKALDKDKPGGTIIPLIISTDKTQLTLFRNKNAYPIYLTIGLVPKEIRRKPSSRAYILMGYLPTAQLEKVTNKKARRRQVANLYHACMSRIFAPTIEAGLNGVHMSTADGLIRRFHPLLACVVGDYPEQVLTTCTHTGECPTCDCPPNDLGNYNPDSPHALRELSAVFKALDSFDTDPAGFLQACKKAGIKPIVDPFWKDLPYVHIYRSITPDILHQLYQGIIKHLINWVTDACGAAEIDARCRRLPPNHNIRIFTKGITTLSRVSGQEHDQMCRILLGLLLDIPLANNLPNNRLIAAVRALLDFLYLAQYPIHTDDTLQLLDAALLEFHDNKDIFIDLGIRTGFKIPKLHWASHYIQSIKNYGTTDNYNTQYTERLHIDLAKDAYAATNHKDEFTQMTVWVERKEKMLRHAQYINWRLAGSPPPAIVPWSPPGLELGRQLRMTKHPSVRRVRFIDLDEKYGAPLFRTALARWVITQNEPQLSRAQIERRLWTVHIPFDQVPVWQKIKYLYQDPFTRKVTTVDSIHARPVRRDSKGREAAARFDTAYINDGNGGSTGTHGYRIGRIRVIFSVPENHHSLLNPGIVMPRHLVYVDWYSAFDEREPDHLLYKIKPMKDPNGSPICSIIPLANIRRSAHLFPRFGPQAPAEWTSSNVLDECTVFYLNEFSDRHFYRVAADE